MLNAEAPMLFNRWCGDVVLVDRPQPSSLPCENRRRLGGAGVLSQLARRRNVPVQMAEQTVSEPAPEGACGERC